MEDPAREGVAAFLESGLGFDVAALAGVVDHAQHVQGLLDAPVMGDGFAERGIRRGKAPVISHRTPNAAASFADAFPSLGRVRNFSLPDSRSARASRLEEIRTPRRSRASSTTPVCREVFDFNGRYYQLKNNRNEPKPVQRPRPPLLIGGWGTQTLRLVAEQADTWNIPGSPHNTVDAVDERSRVLDRHRVDFGRDPAENRGP